MKPLEINKSQSPGQMAVALDTFIEEFGIGFHPDTKAEMYINFSDSLPTFSPKECAVFDKSLEILSDTFGDFLYEMVLAIVFSQED